MGITRDMADKSATITTLLADNIISHSEIGGFDSRVTSVSQPLATTAKTEAETTATALAIALGG